MTTQQPTDLDVLASEYEIIAELGSRDGGRELIARRRSDGLDVVITIARQPAGDERKALTLLAADVKLLSGHTHRALIPVVDGRWIGTDAYAVVRRRTRLPSLREHLATGEDFAFARIGAILQEVNGLLEWARNEKVVHRAISPDTLYIEPGTDRVQVALVVRAIPLAGAPGAEGDARTIAELAKTMLVREVDAEERDAQPLGEVRTDLPQRVIDQTDALLHPARGVALPDVLGYISAIAMAAPIKAGEDEAASLHMATLEEQRITREQLEAERREHKEQVEAQARQFAEERAEHDRQLASEREEMARQHAELEAAVAAERERLAADHDRLANDRAVLEDQRTELQRIMAAQREQLAAERREVERLRTEAERQRATLLRQRESVEREIDERVSAAVAAAGIAAAEARVTEMPVVAAPTVATAAEPVLPAVTVISKAPVVPTPKPTTADREVPVRLEQPADVPVAYQGAFIDDAEDEEPRDVVPADLEESHATPVGRELWAVVGGAAVLAIAIASSAMAVNHRAPDDFSPRTAVVTHQTSNGNVTIDSLGGAVAPTAAGASTAAASTAAAAPDSSARATAASSDSTAADSARATARAVAARRRRAAARLDSTSNTLFGLPRGDSAGTRAPARSDTAAAAVRRDSSARADTGAAPARTPLRRDSVRRDSVRRDTLVRRDSTIRRDSARTSRPDSAGTP